MEPCKKLVIIHLDALGYDLFKKSNFRVTTPSLAYRLESLPAFLGNCATILTSRYPQDHAIWTTVIRDEENSPFKKFPPYALKLFGMLPEKLRMRGMEVIARIYNDENFRHCALPSDKLPFFSSAHKRKLYAYGSLKNSFLDILREKGLSFKYIPAYPWTSPLQRIQQCIPSHNIVYTTYLQIDTLLHEYPEQSKKVKRCVAYVKKELQKILKVLEQYSDFVLVIYADHSMVPIQGTIAIDSLLKTSMLCCIDSTIARFWPETDHEKRALKIVARQNAKKLFILDDKRAKELKLGHIDARYGTYCLLAKEGYIFSPNHFQGNKVCYGMHGYMHRKGSQLDGLLWIVSPRLKNMHLRKKDQREKYARLIDVAPTIMNLAGYTYASAEGTSLVEV